MSQPMKRVLESTNIKKMAAINARGETLTCKDV